MVNRMYAACIQRGKRVDSLPRYVSSVEYVGDEIIVHTSSVPFPISLSRSVAVGSLLEHCTNRPSIWRYEKWIMYEEEFDSSRGLLPQKYVDALRSYIEINGRESLFGLVYRRTSPDQEVSGDEE